MKIENNKLVGDKVSFEATKKTSGEFRGDNLDSVIIHYTASPTFKSAYNSLMGSRQASAHILIDYDGTILQMADFKTRTWHAGKSEYKGRKYFNQYSIGIEIVNPGPLFKRDDYFTDIYGIKYNADKAVKAIHRNNPAMSDYWHKYTDAQIIAVREICELLKADYGIKHILGHEEIAVGRKSDPGPAYPLDELRAEVLCTPSIQGWVYGKYIDEDNSDSTFDAIVTANGLNMRQTIGKGKVLKVLSKHTELIILSKNGNWFLVEPI